MRVMAVLLPRYYLNLLTNHRTEIGGVCPMKEKENASFVTAVIFQFYFRYQIFQMDYYEE